MRTHFLNFSIAVFQYVTESVFQSPLAILQLHGHIK